MTLTFTVPLLGLMIVGAFVFTVGYWYGLAVGRRAALEDQEPGVKPFARN